MKETRAKTTSASSDVDCLKKSLKEEDDSVDKDLTIVCQ